MAVISFASEKVKNDWYGNRVSERLRVIIRALAMKFDGITITCLVRDLAENARVGGAAHSRHVPINNKSRKCEACDFIPKQEAFMGKKIEDYVRGHFTQVVILWHNAGSGFHYHLHCNGENGMQVQIV
jgi:hypothetical protein